jgi:hypothetical protein
MYRAAMVGLSAKTKSLPSNARCRGYVKGLCEGERQFRKTPENQNPILMMPNIFQNIGPAEKTLCQALLTQTCAATHVLKPSSFSDPSSDLQRAS